MLFNEFCVYFKDILNDLDESLINSVFEMLLKDLKFEQIYIASNRDVLPALFSPYIMLIGLENDKFKKFRDLKS